MDNSDIVNLLDFSQSFTVSQLYLELEKKQKNCDFILIGIYMIRTLAIETSCDDTSVGIVSFDGKIFQVETLLAYSQIQNHQQYGGVVPEIASRLHSEKIIEILEAIGRDAIRTVDFVSVTTHPGLPGALVVGKATANLVAEFFGKPVIQANHVYGHLFSLLLERNVNDVQFPLCVLTASGGHNDLYVVESTKCQVPSTKYKAQNIESITKDYGLKTLGTEKNSGIGKHQLGIFSIMKIGQTLDDAAGECFDKVARMLGGPYPGGPWISEKAVKFRPPTPSEGASNLPPDGSPLLVRRDNLERVEFKRIFLSKDGFDFSFSGMKSQVSALLKQLEKDKISLTEKLICEIAYEFQEAVVEVLVKKLLRAGIKYGAKTLGIAGGVSCNERLREYLNEQLLAKQEKLPHDMVAIRPVKKVYSTDNAAMIGLVGILQKSTN